MKSRRYPKEMNIGGKIYPINCGGDYEIILDILEVFKDKDLSQREKSYIVLNIFYDFNLPQTQRELQTAMNELVHFINCGTDKGNGEAQKRKPIMDWNKDFDMIADALIPILGYDVRTPDKYTHWWTFVGAYNQIGEGPFNTVITIRSKKRKHQKLEKWEEEFYNANRSKIDFEVEFSAEEEEFFKNILGDKY